MKMISLFSTRIWLMRATLIITCHFAHAEPIVVDGVVPNEASKQAILQKMQSVYGVDQVVDKIQVRPVSAPNDWSSAVTQMIHPDLKKVKQGKLTVRGTQVELKGKMSHPDELQPTIHQFQSLLQSPYRFSSQLTANQAEQKIIDNALKNRIIEFESGSAILTVSGKQILDEMAAALHQVAGKKVKITGHTDSSGEASKNLVLSQQRANAVKEYLQTQNISADYLSTTGVGSSKPVADNETAEGRRKNRRIEFEVL